MQDDLGGIRIGLLTASASRLGGGVFEAVAAQAALIRERGGEAIVFALEDQYSEEDRHRFAPARVRHSRVAGPRQIGFAPDLLRHMLDAGLDCLHLHGIWMYPSRAGYLWRRQTGRPYLISPHGMLDPWITSRGRWKKVLARAGYERASWQSASALHALTAREARDIEAESGRNDSIVIANPGPAATVQTARPPRAPQFLCLGRIHPKKNIDALIAAWNRLETDGVLPPDARLVIAGWGDEAHVEQLRAGLSRAAPSVSFAGPVYGAAKRELLEQSRFLLLPSLSEGLPMVILEAWAAGTPVLMTTECNLPEGFAQGAALDCGLAPETIAGCLHRSLAMTEPDWQNMSRAATALAEGPFSAATIADQWAGAYRDLIVNSGKPAA